MLAQKTYLLIGLGEIGYLILISGIFVAVGFDHFQILRAIGRGSFGKVSESADCLR